MNVQNINFETIESVKRILKIDKEKLQYMSPKEFSIIAQKADKIITIHLYPFSYGNKKEKCLLDLNRWSYHQIYLCVDKNNIYWAFGHGDTSGSRQNHNELIELFLTSKHLRKKTISAVVLSYRREIIAYYFYDGYSYSNQDIGSNWRDLRKELEKSHIPFSSLRHQDTIKKVIFNLNGKEIEICKIMEEDISHRKFADMIKKKSLESI